MITIILTYEEFLKIKQQRYNYNFIVNMTCKKLNIKSDNIDDIDWDYKLKYNVYLKNEKFDE